ncbi:MAG TPA: ATP-dependent metallopeptidase FtsH/Yme1/Tma family protein [Candidatus Eremiobacteraeota bacterium]|nr:MAG: putative phycocyanin operon protein Z [bacterium ADurb.Bin363]HPZ10640.1 ATP-dependent metallopeptidase FtsH/Yme1/Tma family protein [Candidatus Eremiobacteraeota bacterium]
MKLLSNILICLILIALGGILGFYIYSTYKDYEYVSYNQFISLLEKEAIASVTINKNNIVAVTRGTDKNKEKLRYYILPLSEKDKIIFLLKDKQNLITYPSESYLFIIPYILLFAILFIIIMASRRGNIKETLFKEKKFTTNLLVHQNRKTNILIPGHLKNSITWTHLISGEPFKITTAYSDLSSYEQDKYLLLLIETLHSEDLEIKRNASFALREIGDRRALLPLCKMLEEDKDPHVRMNVALTLGILKDEMSIKSLKKVLEDPNPLVRCSIATAIGAIESEESLTLLKKILKDDDNWRVRRSAIMSLIKFKDEEAFKTIVMAIEDKEPVVRSSVAIALGEMALEEGIKELEKILKHDPEPSVRKEAISALREIGGKPIIKPLCDALVKDQDSSVRMNALDGIELVDDDIVIETLSSVLMNDKDPDIRMAAAEILAGRDNPAIIETLKRSLQDQDEMVRNFVKEELKRMENVSKE